MTRGPFFRFGHAPVQPMFKASFIFRAGSFEEASALYDELHDFICDKTGNGLDGDDHLCALDVGSLGQLVKDGESV